MEKYKLIDILKLAISCIICLSAGFIGSIFTTPAIPTWYAHLNKPSFTPPNWLFGPVWTILYLLMGVSVFLVWRKGINTPQTKIALGIFVFQLILNSLWSIVFFGFKSPLAGLFVILILWVAILLTIITFNKLSTPASILLIPYILWVSFAAILNTSIFILNR